MTKDPDRVKRRAEAAAKLGLSEDELRQKRAADDALHLERKASEAGVPVDRYLEPRSAGGRNQVNRAQGGRQARGQGRGHPQCEGRDGSQAAKKARKK